MKHLPIEELPTATTIAELLEIAPDAGYFRPVRREDLTFGTRLFEVNLAPSTLTETLSPDVAQALLPIFRGWATVQVQVMSSPSAESDLVELIDYLPQVRSGRYAEKVEKVLSKEVILREGRIAYSYLVSPIEVECPLCGFTAKFWPPDLIQEHFDRRHPKSGLLARDVMPWARKRKLPTPA